MSTKPDDEDGFVTEDEEYADEEEVEGDDGDFNDDDDDDILNETVLERLAALVDIVPATTRQRIASTVSSAVSTTKAAGLVVGKGLWVIATAALLVAVPVALEIERESFAIGQENQQRVQASQASQLQSEVATGNQ
ncbi:mitochondrial import receptor protein [Entophlyctis sp. JEL0112]|nr:mitochondrial import receptor protein [Entophlyctis sp. JEL0112]